MSRLTRDGTAEPVSRDQILRHERGQGSIHFRRSADHDQDWQPYPVDPHFCYMCDHTVQQTQLQGRKGHYQKRRAGGTTPVRVEEHRRRAPPIETRSTEKVLRRAPVSERHRSEKRQESTSTRGEGQETPA